MDNQSTILTVVAVGVTTFGVGGMIGYLFGVLVGFRTANTIAKKHALRTGVDTRKGKGLLYK